METKSVKNMRLFHGSDEPFKGFREGAQVSGYYPGFYTSASRELAHSYGKNVTEFEVESIELVTLGPKDGDELKKTASAMGHRVSQGTGAPEVAMLLSRGIKAIRRGMEVIVLDTSVLKSTDDLPSPTGLNVQAIGQHLAK
jgi:hypothetical protein